MNNLDNPYAASFEQINVPATNSDSRPSTLASKGQRFANLIIDQVAQILVAVMIGIAVLVFGTEQQIESFENLPDLVISIPLMLGYYFIFELTTQRTLGKLITGTKVAREDGQNLSVGQILIRTFVRMIPFEAFSFLGNLGSGWHDSISKTVVIKCR